MTVKCQNKYKIFFENKVNSIFKRYSNIFDTIKIIKNIELKNNNLTSKISNNRFVCNSIKPILINNLKKNKTYQLNFKYKNLNSTIIYNPKYLFQKNDKLAKIITRICFIYEFLYKFKNTEVNFKINLILCPESNDKCLKKFNKNINYKKNFIGECEVNSGSSTIFYDNLQIGEVTIWREEELLKVILHECIHAFGIDNKLVFENQNTPIDKKFNVTGYISINECFTEFTANVLNVLISIFENTNQNLNLNKIHKSLEKEKQHSRIQCKKIMNKFGFKTTNELIKKNLNKDNLILKQNSDVFSYYFLKSGMLDNVYENFSKFNNKNIKDTPKNDIYFDINENKIDEIEKLFYSNFEINRINIDKFDLNNKKIKQINNLKMTIIK
jgi:hypothetical protein